MKISSVQLDSLIILKCFDSSPESHQGLLLGVEEDSILTITNAFKTTTTEHQAKMLDHLDKMNYERNVVGRFSNLKDVYGQVLEQFAFQQEYSDGIA
jgi:hypothetical protein